MAPASSFRAILRHRLIPISFLTLGRQFPWAVFLQERAPRPTNDTATKRVMTLSRDSGTFGYAKTSMTCYHRRSGGVSRNAYLPPWGFALSSEGTRKETPAQRGCALRRGRLKSRGISRSPIITTEGRIGVRPEPTCGALGPGWGSPRGQFAAPGLPGTPNISLTVRFRSQDCLRRAQKSGGAFWLRRSRAYPPLGGASAARGVLRCCAGKP